MGHNYMYNELQFEYFYKLPVYLNMHDHCYEYETHLTLMHVSKYIYSFDFTIIISCFFVGHQESLL